MSCGCGKDSCSDTDKGASNQGVVRRFIGKNLFLVFISALILVGVVQQYVLG
ncbi:hypothetical protein JCM19231_5277 [Vibrio ishigakensis]|uniref:Uncharacterized protein n=1 Tax=Vibrio ishigakensis TaxID=1481914 RepID=A0A0B8NWN0_9VIBR|nr:hypothetical protein [Vibrio ishigakensis]GAM55503.1 hypothetical protein JCM19231_5277 [Vibrio ishigakensis]